MPGQQDMSSMLGEIFGKQASAAPAQPSQEDLEKQAQINFFGELCHSRGIDVSRLSDAQVEELYKSAMELKSAGERAEEAKEKGKDEKAEEAKKKEASDAKLASAQQEYAEKRAAAEKIAEAELMGRIMARSLVDEMHKIASESSKVAGELPPQFMKNKEEKPAEGKSEAEGKDEDEKKKKEASARAAAVIAEAEKAKTASASTASASSTPNLDEVAALRGIELCKSAGIDPTLAFNRINAVYVLGLQESTKIASAANSEAAIEVRALEFCEAAGFPVNWNNA